jgi:hypothetical protein
MKRKFKEGEFKINSKSTTSECFHAWLNGLIKKEITKGIYTFNPTEFRIYNTVYGKLVGNFVLCKHFDKTGGFGRGFKIWHIERFTPEGKIFIPVYDKYSLLTSTDESFNDVKHLIKKAILEDISDLSYIAYIKHTIFSTCSTYYALYNNYSHSSGKTRYENVVKYLKYQHPTTYKQTIKEVLNSNIDQVISHTYYVGWSKHYYSHKLTNLKYKDIIISSKTDNEKKATLFLKFVKKELGKEYADEFAFKVWRYKNVKYDNRFLKSLKESREIYASEELKLKFEKERKASISAIELRKQRNAFIKNKELANKFVDNKIYHVYGLAYQLLRLEVKDNYTLLITSYGVKIPLDEAKKLYDFIIKIKEEKSLLRLNLRIGNYVVRGIEKLTFVDYFSNSDITDLCLMVGCHKIPYFEIRRFIEHNNLDW